jgi:hypothetical protein
LIRLILYTGIAILIIFVYKLYKAVTNFKSNSRPDINDLKDRAEHLKNKYKNVEEADFRDITSSDDENENSKK